MATVVTPACMRNSVNFASPCQVVEKRCFSTSTEPSGILMRVQATPVSRWTSRSPTLSRICFISHLLSYPGPPGRTRCEAESRVRARSDTRWSPRSRTRLTVRHARGCKEMPATKPGGRTPALHLLQVTGQVMGTLTGIRSSLDSIAGGRPRRVRRCEWSAAPGSRGMR